MSGGYQVSHENGNPGLKVASDNPDFEAKAADIIGFHLEPPQHTAVFCVDEKSAITVCDRSVYASRSRTTRP